MGSEARAARRLRVKSMIHVAQAEYYCRAPTGGRRRACVCAGGGAVRATSDDGWPAAPAGAPTRESARPPSRRRG
eukprot:4134471-Pyramimonas_sp.AAC.1